MQSSSIFQRSNEVSERLSIFGVTADELKKVAFAVYAARNNATPLHPINSAGTYGYHEGVAALRMLFLGKDGWNIARPNGIEVIENRTLGTTIIFQNVNQACGVHDPRPVSKKGSGTQKFVDNPSGYLFEFMEEEARSKENHHVWFLCVSVTGDEVKMELSRPQSVYNNQFGLFLERIFVLSDNNWIDNGYNSNENLEQDFEINISKKV